MNEENIIQEIEQLKNEIASLKQHNGFKAYLKKAFSKTHVITGVGITILATSLILYAAQITFTDGEVISAEQVNSNFTELFDKAASLISKTNRHDTAIARAASIRDMSRGLIIKNNDTNPTYQIDITAEEVILQDSDYNPLRATEVELLADMEVLGINGRDYGAERDSTWYFIWLISDGTNTVSLLSENSELPLLPDGYKFIARVGAIYNDASLNLIPIFQSASIVSCTNITVVNGGNAATYTSIDISQVVPITAKIVTGQIVASPATASAYVVLTPSNSAFARLAIWANTYGGGNYSLLLKTPQTMYYLVSNCLGTIQVSGWEY